jgi:hypothetical protein
MPRARSLKPGFFSNEDLIELPFEHRLLFAGLWTLADREGRQEDRPKKIKLHIFPGDNVDCDKGLDALASRGFIRRYKVNGIAYIQVINWSKHQSPHVKEAASTIPAPCENSASTSVAALTPDSGLLTPDSGNLGTATSASPPVTKSAERVFDHWRSEWNHPSAKLDAKRRKRIEARLKDFTPDQLCDAISGFKHSPWHNGSDPKGSGVVYDGIETILRDTAQVETGLRLFAHPPRPPPKVEQLSPVERVLRANGVNRDERVVSEQFGSSDAGLGGSDGDVRGAAYTGLRRIGS